MPSLNLRNPLRRDPNRPTLKQRAATLKATAARLIRKPKPLPPAGSPEAVEAFGAACRAVDTASRLSDIEMEALHIMPGGPSLWTSDAVTAALSGDFSRFSPSEIEAARATPRGRLEEVQILAMRRELRMAEAARSSRIRELHALVYGDEPDLIDEDETPAADEPAIAQAIKAHRTAQTAFTAASWAYDKDHVRRTGGDTSDEAMAVAQAAWEAADAAETQAWTRLLKARPASPAGLLQMLRYIGNATTALESVTSPGAFARDIAEAAETALGQPAVMASADPRLVAMVAEWQGQFQKLNDPSDTTPDAEWTELANQHAALQREIYLYPARTPSDLMTKVPVLRIELDDATRGLAHEPRETLAGAARIGLFEDIECIAGAAPALATAADAELVALGRAFDAATIRHREACDALDAAEDRAEPRMPERPATLTFREEDAPFYLREVDGTFAGAAVTSGDIEWMTRHPAQHEVWVDAPPGSKGWDMVPGKVPQIVPWPEAQARIDEIVAAWNAWHAEQDRVMDEDGVTEARDLADVASDAAAIIAQQAAALHASTLAGVWVKVRIAAFYGVADPTASPAEGYTGEAALRSLYRDAPRLMLDAKTADIRIVPEA